MNQEQFERALEELRAGTEDIRPSDVVVFAEPLRSVLNKAVRLGGVSLSDFARELELERAKAKEIADLLVARKLFHPSPFSTHEEIFYETRVSSLTRPLSRPASKFLKKIDD
ncbi:MAG TPA: hypothetical protein VHM28_01975 [Anaerolineales bacterium]|nr:hypothetical protein [Anaerolineales bacterium]